LTKISPPLKDFDVHSDQHFESHLLWNGLYRGDGSKPGLCNSLVQKIVVGVQNDQILKVIAFKFKSGVSFGVGSNLQLCRGGINFVKKVSQMERLLLLLTRLEHR